jgi:hypothetical protein
MADGLQLLDDPKLVAVRQPRGSGEQQHTTRGGEGTSEMRSPVMEMNGDGRILKLLRGGEDSSAPGFDSDSAAREWGGEEEEVR